MRLAEIAQLAEEVATRWEWGDAWLEVAPEGLLDIRTRYRPKEDLHGFASTYPKVVPTGSRVVVTNDMHDPMGWRIVHRHARLFWTSREPEEVVLYSGTGWEE